MNNSDQRTTRTTGHDLFICFKSPSNRDPHPPPMSLTTSVSRRLKTNRTPSPAMFKKSSSGFDRHTNNGHNPEPSSPKVTCIGQVRVKTKRRKNKKRSLSRRSSFSGHDILPENRTTGYNTKWVHFPLTVCEGFSCLFPCRSSCFSPVKEDSGNRRDSGSCGDLCTRWLVALHDDDGGRRDVELVVGDDDDDDDVNVRVSSRRHHVFDDLKIVNNRVEGNNEGRLSICVPPKNALLLMRCRSDPLKMEALANRLWDSTVSQNDDDDDDDQEFEDVDEFKDFQEMTPSMEEENLVSVACYQRFEKSTREHQEPQIQEMDDEKDDGFTFFGSLFDEIIDQDFEEIVDVERHEPLSVTNVLQKEPTESNVEKVNGFEESNETEGLPECLLLMMCEPKLSMEVSKETWVSKKDFFRRNSSRKKPPPAPLPAKLAENQEESKVSVNIPSEKIFENFPSAAAAAVQPGRSSCSLPAPPSMAEMIEQKLVNAVGYEPFVLTRCKSEPMRTAAAKLAPDSCFWKNRKLEPLRRASFGIGAAGVGF